MWMRAVNDWISKQYHSKENYSNKWAGPSLASLIGGDNVNRNFCNYEFSTVVMLK